MDYFAVISNGTFPEPLSLPTNQQRAVYFASHGLLGSQNPYNKPINVFKSMFMDVFSDIFKHVFDED